MKLTKFKERNHKKIGIILFTISCVLLVTVVFLYKSFALFTTNERKNIIKGNVENMGDLYFNFYVNDTLQKEMPPKESGLVLDEEKSYCGVSGKKDPVIKLSLANDYVVRVSGMTSLSTKCNLYFIENPLSGIPIVEDGPGLYEVTNDLKGWYKPELRYAGPSNQVNNYVTFNNELWRIIGLVNVQTTNGTITQRLKIIKADIYMTTAWDSRNTNDWTNASLKETLNGEYLNSMTNKDMIATDIRWNLGGFNDYNVVASEYYQYERGTTVYTYEERPTYWDGQVGLMYPSDYGYATSGGSTSNRSTCLTTDLYSWYTGSNQTDCLENDWLYDSSYSEWTLMPYSRYLTHVFRVFSSGNVSVYDSASGSFAVRPALYLKSNITISGGNGSFGSPFQLSL